MAAGIIPALIAGGASIYGAERARATNIKLAREQMAFQERMSGTAYQRAVEDMRLAGINPMLAYSQGGASSPGGQTARVEDTISPAVSSAMHLTRLRQELKNMRAVEDKDRSAAQLSRTTGYLHEDNRLVAQQEWLNRRLVGEQLRLQLPQMENEAAVARSRLGLGSTYVDRVRRAIFGGVIPAIGVGGKFRLRR